MKTGTKIIAKTNDCNDPIFGTIIGFCHSEQNHQCYIVKNIITNENIDHYDIIKPYNIILLDDILSLNPKQQYKLLGGKKSFIDNKINTTSSDTILKQLLDNKFIDIIEYSIINSKF